MLILLVLGWWSCQCYCWTMVPLFLSSLPFIRLPFVYMMMVFIFHMGEASVASSALLPCHMKRTGNIHKCVIKCYFRFPKYGPKYHLFTFWVYLFRSVPGIDLNLLPLYNNFLLYPSRLLSSWLLSCSLHHYLCFALVSFLANFSWFFFNSTKCTKYRAFFYLENTLSFTHARRILSLVLIVYVVS